MNEVVIVVPGIMGSVLRLGDEIIWPGKLSSLIVEYKKMPELMREDLTATDLIRKYGLLNVYSSLLDDLAACGLDETSKPPTLYLYPYDWRKSNVLAADGLANLVERVLKEHGDAVQVTMVAHSMGGIVSRYYLESGKYSSRPGFGLVRSLITIATPHRGASLALSAALGLEKRLFLSETQVLQLVSDPRYPSLYEMLPPRDEPFVWDGSEDTFYARMDIYEKELATGAGGLGLIGQNLEAALSFHSGLDFDRRPKPVRYFSFYGTRQRTNAQVRIDQHGARYRARAIEFDDAGDGTVPVWSGQPDGIQSMPVGGEHMALFRNSDLRQTLAVLLGAPGTLALSPEAAGFNGELSVSPKVANPAAPVSLTLLFREGLATLKGQLHFERVVLDTAGNQSSATTAGKPVEIQYSGGTADKLGLLLVAPEFPGFYRVVFEAVSGEIATDDLIVQEATG